MSMCQAHPDPVTPLLARALRTERESGGIYILLTPQGDFPESNTTSNKNRVGLGPFSRVLSGCISFKDRVYCCIWSPGSMEGQRTLQILFVPLVSRP